MRVSVRICMCTWLCVHGVEGSEITAAHRTICLRFGSTRLHRIKAATTSKCFFCTAIISAESPVCKNTRGASDIYRKTNVLKSSAMGSRRANTREMKAFLAIIKMPFNIHHNPEKSLIVRRSWRILKGENILIRISMSHGRHRLAHSTCSIFEQTKMHNTSHTAFYAIWQFLPSWVNFGSKIDSVMSIHFMPRI